MADRNDCRLYCRVVPFFKSGRKDWNYNNYHLSLKTPNKSGQHQSGYISSLNAITKCCNRQHCFSQVDSDIAKKALEKFQVNTGITFCVKYQYQWDRFSQHGKAAL